MSKGISLEQFVKEKGTALDVAAAIGVHSSSITYWIKAKRVPTIHLAWKLVKYSKGRLTLESIYKPAILKGPNKRGRK